MELSIYSWTLANNIQMIQKVLDIVKANKISNFVAIAKSVLLINCIKMY